MREIKTVVVAGDVVTPYGQGVDACWDGLLSGKTAIRPFDRFPVENFHSNKAAVVPGLTAARNGGATVVMQMLGPMSFTMRKTVPADALLILATTTGEIDLLENNVLNGTGNAQNSCLANLLKKLEVLCGTNGQGMVISAACASSSSAVAHGAALIRSGQRDCVMVVACDSVSEFVFSGFSSLMALDPDTARPFDKRRRGLSIGEAAGYVLLMSDERASREKRTVLGEIAGWGLASDANHMTGPSRDGYGLAQAVRKALTTAGISSEDIGCVAAHGTGTVYNDAMELKAFKQIFGSRQVPLYSIKGGTGHTMGAAGLVELMIALRSLKEQLIPPTVGLREADDDAREQVFNHPVECAHTASVSTNAGFGGINAALVIRRGTA